MVIKKDGRRERFERQKILQGLLKACEKRPVPTPRLEAIMDEIEGVVHEATERELTTTEIGEMIMHRLKKLDKVAYVAIRQRVYGFQGRPGIHVRTKEPPQRPRPAQKSSLERRERQSPDWCLRVRQAHQGHQKRHSGEWRSQVSS